jgi:hypothetical protein
MTDKPKVSDFPGRKALAAPDDKPKLALPDSAKYQGEDHGTFARPFCGSCIHWKKSSGPGNGTCMMMPPTGFPVPGPNGQIAGIMNVRPTMNADHEGCDQHEDIEGNQVFEDDGDGGAFEPEPPADLLKSVGG